MTPTGGGPNLSGTRPEHYELILQHSDALTLLAEAATGLAPAGVPRVMVEGLAMTRAMALQQRFLLFSCVPGVESKRAKMITTVSSGRSHWAAGVGAGRVGTTPLRRCPSLYKGQARHQLGNAESNFIETIKQ